MRPTKLSSNVFLELPPNLAHFIETDRNSWLEGNPKRGRVSLLNRSGTFQELESQAIERKYLLQMLGTDRLRAIKYQSGFEVGRRDALRHYETLGDNARLALQAGLVFGQMQGKYVAEDIKFEFDLEESTLYREVQLQSSTESVMHRMIAPDDHRCVCWFTAGYISGHVSELVGRRVLTLESGCTAQGESCCEFVSKFDSEWGSEGDWVREAMKQPSIEQELADRDEQLEKSQLAARKAQASLGGINRRLRSDLASDSLIAESKEMLPTLRRMQLCMQSHAPVLICGESGVGKESVARSIHYGSERKKRPFIEIDCKGIPGTIIKQELIGYEADTIPGSIRAHKGAVQKASGGTLYFNEITDLDMDLQRLLLQILESNKVQPIGSETKLRADVRVMAATQNDLEKAVKKGTFREDLYYALAISRVDIPPLRKRATDILRLAEAFLIEFKERHKCDQVTMTGEFREAIMDCAWPGNVRQLRNVIEHAVLMSSTGRLTPKDLPEEILASRWVRKPEHLTEEVILATLSRTHNNKSEAADLLGIGRTTLWRTMKKLGID